MQCHETIKMSTLLYMKAYKTHTLHKINYDTSNDICVEYINIKTIQSDDTKVSKLLLFYEPIMKHLVDNNSFNTSCIESYSYKHLYLSTHFQLTKRQVLNGIWFLTFLFSQGFHIDNYHLVLNW